MWNVSHCTVLFFHVLREGPSNLGAIRGVAANSRIDKPSHSGGFVFFHDEQWIQPETKCMRLTMFTLPSYFAKGVQTVKCAQLEAIASPGNRSFEETSSVFCTDRDGSHHLI